VALLGSDVTQDFYPSPYEGIDAPLHVIGIVAMGLWLLDNAWLEDVARVSIELERNSFLFSGAPLKLKRGTGSAINPLAIF